MDESHRLKEMPSNYDAALFTQLYKETKELRHKLAFGIDSRKFGVDYKEIVSWFDVKFIYAFNRYYGDPRLKGYIIRALQTYKTRIVKNSYQGKHSINNTTDVDGMFSLNEDLNGLDLADEPTAESRKEELIDTLKLYFRRRLSLDAYLLWEFENFPPAYTLQQKTDNLRITEEDAIDFFSLEDSEESYLLLRNLKKEIKEITKRAKEYFSYKKAPHY